MDFFALLVSKNREPVSFGAAQKIGKSLRRQRSDGRQERLPP